LVLLEVPLFCKTHLEIWGKRGQGGGREREEKKHTPPPPPKKTPPHLVRDKKKRKRGEEEANILRNLRDWFKVSIAPAGKRRGKKGGGGTGAIFSFRCCTPLGKG